MAKTNYSGGNHLLDRLPQLELEALKGHVEVVTLSSGQLLYAGSAEQALEYVYFPINGVTSMLATMADGSAVEAGTVGREGMIGAQSAFGSARMMERWISQVPGLSARMTVGDFRMQFRRNPTLRIVVQRYVQSYMAFLAQSVACNSLHLIVERCARWLLLTHDRAGRDVFSLTHEFLALMLGVRRPGVSLAAATLADGGLIAYARGNVTIRDRAGLEAASCECYQITTNETTRLFGEAFRKDEADGFVLDGPTDEGAA